MALSKLAIGLIAGIGSVIAVGGITTGIVVSRNNAVAETVNENNESNSKENKTSNDRDALMADESRKNDSTDTVSQVGMKDPSVERSDETESEIAKQPDKPTSHNQDTSGGSSFMQSATAQPASIGPTMASTDAEGQGGEMGMAEAGAQQASAGTDDKREEVPEGKVGSAAGETTVEEDSLPDGSVAGDRQSQAKEIQSQEDQE